MADDFWSEPREPTDMPLRAAIVWWWRPIKTQEDRDFAAALLYGPYFTC